MEVSQEKYLDLHSHFRKSLQGKYLRRDNAVNVTIPCVTCTRPMAGYCESSRVNSHEFNYG